MKKERINLFFALVGISLFCTLHTIAQKKMNYWGDIDGFLREQSEVIFTQAYKVLDTYPPGVNVGDERKLALYAIDGALHDVRLDNGTAFRNYMNNMVDRVVNQLRQKVNKDEVNIIRFYNHGFIIQTLQVNIGIDLVRGGSKEEPYINDAFMKSVVDYCDVMFITHLHRDHADDVVAKMFYEQKKEIFVPSGLWENVSPYIKPLRAPSFTEETIYITGKKVPLKVGVFPGHQDKLLNNIYVITTPDGLAVMHTGDQSKREDMEWIAKIKERVKIDILLVHCWMTQMKEIVDGSSPSLIICGHENEMGHTVDHREPYWLTFRRMQDITVPYIIMAWGETYSHKFQ